MKVMPMLILFGLVNYGCNSKRDGRPGVSHSISDSERREVFIDEYNVKIKSISPDTPPLKVIEAWVEKKWRFTKYDYDDTNIQDGYQLCMRVEKGSINGLNSEWFIERKRRDAIGQIGQDILWISDFGMVNSDSVFFKIFAGPPKLRPFDSKPIGE